MLIIKHDYITPLLCYNSCACIVHAKPGSVDFLLDSLLIFIFLQYLNLLRLTCRIHVYLLNIRLSTDDDDDDGDGDDGDVCCVCVCVC